MKATEIERDGLTIYVMMAGNGIFFFFFLNKKVMEVKGVLFLEFEL